MIRRWNRSTSTTSGRVITIEAAVIWPHGYCAAGSAPSNCAMATVAGQPVRLAHEGAREEELVPGLDEQQDRGGEDARRRQRHHDLEEGLHPRAAIHARRLLQLGRQVAEEGGQRPDADRQREGHIRQDQRQVVVGQAPGVELPEQRSDDRDAREHRDRQDQRQQQVLERGS